MSITRIGVTETYKVKLTMFRDNRPGTAGMPTSQNFQTFVQGTNANANVNFTANRTSVYYATYDPRECPPPGADLSLEIGIFEYTLTQAQAAQLSNSAGYYFSGNICCRNAGATNVVGPSSGYGITFTMDFPRLSTGVTKYNSSPRFAKAPLAFYCVGKPYTINWDCTDPDGDSLSYSLAPPTSDNNVTKPFALCPYNPGYNLNYNVIDGVPDLTINPKTGIINFIPTRTGVYLVGFKVAEWRKINGVPTKIGEITREFQLETVLCPEAPPVTEDNNNQKRNIVDTINLGEEFISTFTSRDSPLDSIFMYLVPNISPGENVLDPNTLEGKWGEIGSLTGGASAQNLIIDGQGVIVGQFKWKPKCSAVRDKPYTFTVVVRDKTCPSPFYDSTYVTLYVKKKDNVTPMFTNKYLGHADTIKNSTPINRKTKRYFIRAGDTFQLAADSIIKTYDRDSAQTVNIAMIPDPANGSAINGKFLFSSNPGLIHSTATFIWNTTCADKIDDPIKVSFIAYDDDCLSPDTIRFNIEINIKDQPNKKPIYAHSNPDTVRIPEGTIDTFTITIYDSLLNVNINKYKQITLYPDTTDFTAAQLKGGVPISISSLTDNDSLKVNFIWAPNCANVRSEPYRIFMRVSDEGCPTINNYDTVYVYAMGPYNSAPEFRNKDDIKITTIDTTIYGGDVFNFNLFAVDTNQRFDSVYIKLDPSSDIANPTLVKNIAFVMEVNGKDSARTDLYWNSNCSDIRSTPYVARVMARDNECVNPEVGILTFNITVRERPNFLPKFTFSNQQTTEHTIYAGEVFDIDLTVLDSTSGETVTMDTVYTNIPYYLPKPVITRAVGIANDTLKTNLNWIADCSLIRDEPYYIKVGAWDGACRNPQDSATHIFKIYIVRNPKLNPSFAMGTDTTIELVAGEKFSLELNSASELTGDSILISSTGDVYGGIPGTLATFEQSTVTPEGNALFKWETSCDQIRDSLYTVIFSTANPPCKTDVTGFTIKFKVIPNTDLTNPIPNVFSPNGDKINDTYSINKQYKVYCDPGFKFTIFNRWGKIVFESKDPDFIWEAEGLGSGTYFYTLESKARSQSGTIDIIK